LDPSISQLIRLAFAYPVGAGVFTFLLFLISWVGIPIGAFSVISSYLLALVSILLFNFRFVGSWDLELEIKSDRKSTRLDRFVRSAVLIIVAALILIAGYLSVMRSYSTWDAIGIWGVKGYAIGREGTIFAAGRYGSHGLSYPLDIPLQISLFQLFGGDNYSFSKLIFSAYYAALLLSIWTLLRFQSRSWLGSLGVLLVATIPILFEHATIGYANLPFSYYLVLGFLLFIEGLDIQGSGIGLIGALLLGLATWTRPEGTHLVLFGLVALGIVAALLKFDMKNYFQKMAPALTILLPWLIFSTLKDDQGVVGRSFASMLSGWSQGVFNLEAVYWTARYSARQVFDPRVWGLILPATTLMIFVGWKSFTPVQRRIFFHYSAVFVSMIITIFIYFYLASFTNDIHYLLGTSVNRIFMPAWMFVGTVSGAIASMIWKSNQDIEKSMQ
jgi:hypothetical protein